MSVLEGDLSFLRSLVDIGEDEQEEKRWKFYLNLAGSELPLKTVPEMQEILKDVKDGIFEGKPVAYKHSKRLIESLHMLRSGRGKFDFTRKRNLKPRH